MSFYNPSVPVQAGYYVNSVAFPLYAQSTVTDTFMLPSNQTSLQVLWYGHVGGVVSSPIQAQLKSSIGTVVGSASVPASSITSSDAWQSPFQFSGSFPAGRYTLLRTSAASDAVNCYQVEIISGFVNDGTCIWLAPGNGSSGSPCLLIEDGVGNILNAYPFQALNDGHLGSILPTTFTAPVSFSAKMVTQFLADHQWDPSLGALQIRDAAGNLLATGILDQNLTQGAQGMVSIALDNVVNFVGGNSYSINVSGPGSWTGVLRGLYSDPPLAGYGKSCDAFKIPQSSYQPMFSDVNAITTTGVDSVRSGVSMAVSFVPSFSGTLQEFHLLLLPGPGQPTTGFRAPGDTLVASLYGSTPNSGFPPFYVPVGGALSSVSITSDSVPWHGFADFTSFSYPLTGGTRYWMALSSSAAVANEFAAARLVSGYRFLCLGNRGGGWAYLGEGPTDFSFRAVTSAETIGNFVTDIPYFASGDGAQPFIAPQNMTVNGIEMLSGFYLAGGWSDYANVTIEQGSSPSGISLGGGKFHTAEQRWRGSQFVGFDTAASLTGGDTYCIVMRKGSAGLGGRGLSPIVYYIQPSNWPSGLNALVDPLGTGSWGPVLSNYPGSVAAIIPFGLAQQASASVTIPTTTQVMVGP